MVSHKSQFVSITAPTPAEDSCHIHMFLKCKKFLCPGSSRKAQMCCLLSCHCQIHAHHQNTRMSCNFWFTINKCVCKSHQGRACESHHLSYCSFRSSCQSCLQQGQHGCRQLGAWQHCCDAFLQRQVGSGWQPVQPAGRVSQHKLPWHSRLPSLPGRRILRSLFRQSGS